jgi:hypothetical protein
MDSKTILEDDGFEHLMQLQGWTRNEFDYEPIWGNHNVIGQIGESSVTSCESRTSPSAFFFHFEDTTFRKLLRYIFFHRKASQDALLKICSNVTILHRHVSYMLEMDIVVQNNDLWEVAPSHEHIPDLGKTLEWYVTEWFYINLQVPTRYGVHIKGLVKGGDLDVVAFPAAKPVMVECKTSRPDAIGDEELHLFLQRTAYFKPLKALLLVDTDSKIDSLSERLRRIYVTSEIIGPFTSSTVNLDLHSVNISNTRKGLHMALSSVLDNSKSDFDQPLAEMSLLDIHKIAEIIPGLNKSDSQVLKMSCEIAIETDNSQVIYTQLLERAEQSNVLQDSVDEAIEILRRKGYIKRRFPALIEVLIDGFEEYAKVYVANYSQIKKDVASYIINNELTPYFNKSLASSLNCPPMLIDHILDYFDNKEFIKLIVFQGGSINIINISPSLRRVIREGEDI